MIHLLIGKPRNGKSLRAAMHVLEQLTTTRRDVVTNMVLDLDEIQDWLDSHGHNILARSRIRMLNDKETRNFWLYRVGYEIPTGPDYDEKKGADVDFTPMFREPRFIVGGQKAIDENKPLDLRGTCYVIDEVHTIWPARGWQGTARHVDFYNSQHGKLNDEIWFITQNTKLVDPNFYRLAQDFTYCRNHRLLKFGHFRGENKFVAKTYEQPTATGQEVTLNVFEYKLDLSVARCYDTSAGVGMPGGGTADAGQRAKGVPLKLVWVGLAAVLALVLWFFSWGMPMFTRKFIAPALDGRPHAETKPQSGGVIAAAVGDPSVTFGGAHARPTAPEENPDRVTGYALGRYSASWFDGWLPLDEAAQGDSARLDLLMRYERPKPQRRPQIAAQ